MAKKDTTNNEVQAAADDRPTCPLCKIPCTASSTRPFFTYYACPTEGCGFTTKKPRRDKLAARRKPAPGETFPR